MAQVNPPFLKTYLSYPVKRPLGHQQFPPYKWLDWPISTSVPSMAGGVGGVGFPLNAIGYANTANNRFSSTINVTRVRVRGAFDIVPPWPAEENYLRAILVLDHFPNGTPAILSDVLQSFSIAGPATDRFSYENGITNEVGTDPPIRFELLADQTFLLPARPVYTVTGGAMTLTSTGASEDFHMLSSGGPLPVLVNNDQIGVSDSVTTTPIDLNGLTITCSHAIQTDLKNLLLDWDISMPTSGTSIPGGKVLTEYNDPTPDPASIKTDAISLWLFGERYSFLTSPIGFRGVARIHWQDVT